MEPLDFLTIFRQRWKIILAAVLISAGLAWFTTPASVKTGPPVLSYTATATLIQAPGSSLSLPFVALLSTGDPVRKAAAKEIGYTGDPATLASSVSVSPDTTLGTLSVTASDPDGPTAAKLANGYADAIIATLGQQVEAQRQSQISTLRTQITSIQAQVASLTSQAAAKPNDPLLQFELSAYKQQLSAAVSQWVTLYTQVGRDVQLSVLQPATPLPVVSGGFSAPSSHRGRLLMGIVVGLILGLLLALLVDRIDTRLRRREDVEEAYRLPVVAEVPHTRRRGRRRAAVAVFANPVGQVAEAYRSLRTALTMLPSRVVAVDTWGPAPVAPPAPARTAKGPQVVLVTSARAGEGKSTTAANLAATLAESGKRVLVVDADFRNPSMHRLFDVSAGAGLADLLAPDSPPELGVLPRLTDVPNIRVLTAGHSEQFRGGVPTRIAAVIAESRQFADAIVIDAAPILGSSDALDFLAYVDSVVVVARLGRVNREQAGRVSDLLGRAQAPVLGVVCIGGRRLLRGSYPRIGPQQSSGSRRRRGREAKSTTGAGAS